MNTSKAALRRACYGGYVVQAVVNNLLPLFFVLFQDGYGLSYARLGSLILVNFLSQLAVDLLSIPLTRALGTKRSVLLAHALAAAGLLGMVVLPYRLPTYIGLLIAVVTCAIGSGLIEVLVSPIVEKTTEEDKTGHMSLLHSFYCWGQAATVLVATLLLRLMSGSWQWVPALFALIPAFNFFVYLSLAVPEIEDTGKEKTETGRRDRPFGGAIAVLFLLMMTAAGASELVMAQWASTFAERGLGVNKTVGDLIGPCLFALLMGTGRLLYSRFAARLEPFRTMAAASALCVLCYVTAALSPFPYLSLAACAVCGFSVSLMWPGVLSMAGARYPSGGALMYGLLATAGDLGCAAGPWVAGLLIGAASFSVGFAAAALFPIGMIVCSLCLIKKKG